MPRDNNYQNNTLTEDTDGNVANLLVDPSTGRLLIAITVVSEPASPVLNSDKRDENYSGTAQAVDGSDNIIPLHIDSRNSLLFVDVLEE